MDRLIVIGEPGPHMIVRAGAAVIPIRPDGTFLLELRKDCGLWGLVGGRVEPGESVAASALRECREETGLEAEIDHLLGVYSRPQGRMIRFEPSGDERQIMDVVLVVRVPQAARAQPSPESADLRWFDRPSLPPREKFLEAAWEPVSDFLDGRRGLIR
jgi:8-oxo-dGTP pyrophosphatase MutT (NUDIX family)